MVVVQAAHMALPAVRTLRDCADYSTTFEAYLPQLYALPQQIYESIGDVEALTQIYVSTNPAIFGLAVSLALFPIFFIVAEANKNYSQVDRVWSILPTVFNFHYALWARLNGLPTTRVDNVLAFSVVWSMRLTYNYWRKGGYQIGSEDYRWELIKGYIGSFGFLLLNIVFISSLQLVSLSPSTFWLSLTRRRSFSGVSLYPHTSCSSPRSFSPRWVCPISSSPGC